MLITRVPGAQQLNCLLPGWEGGEGRQGQAALGAGVCWPKAPSAHMNLPADLPRALPAPCGLP